MEKTNKTRQNDKKTKRAQNSCTIELGCHSNQRHASSIMGVVSTLGVCLWPIGLVDWNYLLYNLLSYLSLHTAVPASALHYNSRQLDGEEGMSPPPLFIQLLTLRAHFVCIREFAWQPIRGKMPSFAVEEDYSLHSAAYGRKQWNWSLSDVVPTYSKGKQTSTQVTMKPAQVVCICETCPSLGLYLFTTLRVLQQPPSPEHQNAANTKLTHNLHLDFPNSSCSIHPVCTCVHECIRTALYCIMLSIYSVQCCAGLSQHVLCFALLLRCVAASL